MTIINMKVPAEDELYNDLDPDGIQLSDNVKGYVFEKMLRHKDGREIEIRILSPAAIDTERLKSAFDSWLDDELYCISQETSRNRTQQLYFLLLGLLFILASMALQSHIPAIWFTVLSTIGGFSIWEASSVWLLKNPTLKLKKLVLTKLRKHTSITVISEYPVDTHS